MVKRELPEIIDDELLEKLYGFCYARTNDSYEAEDLCSDIVYALIKAAGSGRAIEDPYPFIWKVARNKYADFSEKRARHSEMQYEGDPEEAMAGIAAAENDNDDEDSDKLNLTGFIFCCQFAKVRHLIKAGSAKCSPDINEVNF